MFAGFDVHIVENQNVEIIRWKDFRRENTSENTRCGRTTYGIVGTQQCWSIMCRKGLGLGLKSFSDTSTHLYNYRSTLSSLFSVSRRLSTFYGLTIRLSANALYQIIFRSRPQWDLNPRFTDRNTYVGLSRRHDGSLDHR